MKLNSLILTLLALSPFANATQWLEVENAYVRATPPHATTSAMFATIHNNSDRDRTLVSATTDLAQVVELHDVIMDGDMMQMRQISRISIPASQSVALAPGSLHVMLLDLLGPLKEGQQVAITLTFADNETVTLQVPVKKVMAGMKMKHH
ncbi:copper chaperone PCu(A)C [Vibrio hippocampi]|uniref:Copper chaperone PCu(A)C n=1 Tax=Vibrio hippocampi TaxID=654686 RepID=A0ABM8ZNV5_9VIBR|nr:copper chaperone PCu(A)C [Vibrio hippocampi]CAH0530358.1 hypothetical protein VHP8226_04001 [Vibrio hippocampi]